MNELSFNDLPFVPDEKQVIYIERSYHRTFNKFIRGNYEWIKKTFFRYGLEFFYLPLSMQDAISYNAPYLSEKERAAELAKVPSLTDFLIGHRDLKPSLVFALDIPVVDEDGNTVLQFVSIETKWFLSTKRSFSHLAEEVNRIRKTQSLHCHQLEEEKRNQLEQEKNHQLEEEKRNQLETEKETEDRKGDSVKFSIGGEDQIKFSLGGDNQPRFSISDKTDSIDEEYKIIEDADYYFDDESKKLIKEIKELVEALRNKGVNTMILHDIIDKGERLSRLRITRDFRIFLVDYENLEIKMPVLPKAVFFLFLRHPEGIRFKELSDYYSELLQIYLKMNPIGGRMRQEQSIRDITDPCSNSINEKCARIREAFIGKFDERLAQNYFVTGPRGEAKRIALDNSMIIWE